MPSDLALRHAHGDVEWAERIDAAIWEYVQHIPDWRELLLGHKQGSLSEYRDRVIDECADALREPTTCMLDALGCEVAIRALKKGARE